MYLIIIRDKYCLHTAHALDQIHPFLKSQRVAGGAEGIAVNGAVGYDGDLIQIILDRIAGSGIKDMVIDGSVFFKIPLIIAGSHNRLISDLKSGENGPRLIKRSLQADPERRAVTAVPNGKHISSQVDKGMPDSLSFQIILQPVGNVALGDTSQIDLRIRIGQCDG